MAAIRKTFGLQQLFLSTACFALAIGIISFNNRLESDPDNRTLFLLAIPTVGAAIGAGIGVLIGRTRKYAIMGAIIPSLIVFGMWMHALIL